MSDAGTITAGSVVVEIGAPLASLSADLAKAQTIVEQWDARVKALLSASGAAKAMGPIAAAAAQAETAFASVTAAVAPAQAQMAKISAVAAAASDTIASMSSATATGAVSASAMAKALEMTGGDLTKITPQMLGLADTTGALAAASTEAAAATMDLGTAQARASSLTSGATVEIGRLMHALLTGQMGRAASETMTLGTRLGEAGASALTFENITKSIGSFAGVFVNPYVLGFFAIGTAIDLASRAMGAFSDATVTASQALKQHQQEISATVAGWKSLEQAMAQYTQSVSQLPIGASLIQMNQELADATKRSQDFATYTKQLGTGLSGSLDSADQLLAAYLDKFNAGKETVADLVTQLQGMKDSDLGGFNNLNISIGGLHLSMKSLIDDLITLGQKTSDDKNLMEGLKAAIQSVGLANTLGQQNLDRLLTGDFDALAAAKSAAEFKNSMASIYALSPSAKGRVAYNQSQTADNGTDISQALMLQHANQASALASAQASFAIQRANQMQILSAMQAVQALKVQASTIGLSIGATATLTERQQLLSAAETLAAQNGVSVSADQVAAINKVSAAYGEVQQKIAAIQSMSDAKFDFRMLGLTSTDQQIAGAMRNLWGDSWSSHMNDADASLMRLTGNLGQYKDALISASDTFSSTFISDLRNGSTAFQSFADAASQALDQIAQKLIDMAIENLWSNAFGGLTSGGGNWLTALFGGASSGSSDLVSSLGMGANGVIGGFASGTNSVPQTGLYRVGETGPELVQLPASARVYNAAQTASMFNSAANSGSNDNGLTIHVNVDARGAQQGAGAEIATALTSFARNQLPTLIRQYNANPNRRGYVPYPTGA